MSFTIKVYSFGGWCAVFSWLTPWLTYLICILMNLSYEFISFFRTRVMNPENVQLCDNYKYLHLLFNPLIKSIRIYFDDICAYNCKDRITKVGLGYEYKNYLQGFKICKYMNSFRLKMCKTVDNLMFLFSRKN